MAALQCEICGGRLIGKTGGIFECDSCGTEYSTEWASAKIQQIKGTVKVEGTVQVAGTVTIEGGISTASLLKRGELALEDREWDNARKAFDRALDMDPENGHAYFGKLMAEYRVRSGEELSALSREFTSSANYQKVLRFADEALSAKLEEILQIIEQREEAERREKECREAEARKEKERREQLARKKTAENQKKAQKQAKTAAHAVKIALPVVAVIAALAVAIPMLTQKPEQEIPEVTGVQMEVVATEVPATEETTPSAEEIQYSQAEAWEADGQLGRAAIAFGKLGDYNDARERSFALWSQMPHLRETISTGDSRVFGIKKDGSVIESVPQGPTQYVASNWSDVVDISVGSNYNAAGLKSDGTVFAAADESVLQVDVSNWTDIVAVSASFTHIAGLKVDGTVVASGNSVDHLGNVIGGCNVSDWADIIAIATGQGFTAGLKSDGTVVVTENNGYEQELSIIAKWTDIIAISAASGHVVGLKSDGTVVAAGANNHGVCNVSEWRDIISIYTGPNNTIGLRDDGTMVVLGYNKIGFSHWKDVVAMASSYNMALGLKSDGTVIGTGNTDRFSDWTNIALPGELTMSE